MQPLRSPFIQRQSRRTAFPSAQSDDQSLFKRSTPIPQGNNGQIHLLLVLHLKRVGRQQHFKIMRPQPARPMHCYSESLSS